MHTYNDINTTSYLKELKYMKFFHIEMLIIEGEILQCE